VVGRDDRRMAGWDAHVPRLWRGGRGSASPLQRGRTHPRSGRWAPRWGAHPRLV